MEQQLSNLCVSTLDHHFISSEEFEEMVFHHIISFDDIFPFWWNRDDIFDMLPDE